MRFNQLILQFLFFFISTNVNSQAFSLAQAYCINSTVVVSAGSGSMAGTNYTWTVLPTTASLSSPNTYSTIISFSSTGIHTVLVQFSNGSMTVNYQQTTSIVPPPSLSVSANVYTTCIIMNSPMLSKPVTLTASGAPNYSWNPPPNPPMTPTTGLPSSIINVRPNVTTCYTVSSSISQCSAQAVICVTVIPQFTISISPSSATICLGQTLTLISESIGLGAVGPPSAYTYSWTEALNAPPISMSSYLTPSTNVFPQNSTTYTVEISDALWCVSQPQVASVTVLSCNSLEEVDRQDLLHFYPNPVQDFGELSFTGSTTFTVNITTLTGDLILSKIVDSPDKRKIDMRALESGVYILHVYCPRGNSYSMKLIKQE